MDKIPTYAELFAFLASLGFEESSTDQFERVFEHSDSDAVLMFSLTRGTDEQSPVRPADLLSAEVHLRGNALISEPLEGLVRSHAEARRQGP